MSDKKLKVTVADQDITEKVIFSSEGYDIEAWVEIAKDGGHRIGLRGVKNGRIGKPVSAYISNLRKGEKDLIDTGIYMDAVTLNRFHKAVVSNLDTLPVRQMVKGLGFGIDGKFYGAFNIDKEGNIYRSERFQAGEEPDLEVLKQFVTNTKRTLLLLHTLASPLVACDEDLSDLPILFVYGESSIGKTVAARYLNSLAVPKNERTLLDFDATKAGLIEHIGSNFGIPICIDDTSLADTDGRKEKTALKNLIYSLANGREKTTKIKRGTAQFRTTILITAENNDLLKISSNYKGIFGRAFPMYVEKGDLFNDTQEIEQCRTSTRESAGATFSILVSEMRKRGIEGLLNKAHEVRKKLESECGSDTQNVISRWCEYWGLLSVTADLLKELFELDINMGEVISYMKEEIALNLNIQQEGSLKEQVLNELLPSVIEKSFTTKNGDRYIQVKVFNSLADDHKINRRIAKDILYRAGRIVWQGQDLTRNLGKEYGRCLQLAAF